jgi:hypothetical protein
MGEFLQRIPLLLITSALLIGGVVENEVGSGNQALLAVGFVSFGAWLAIEVQSWYQKLRAEWTARDDKSIEDDKQP